jgi:hypothetical protein
MALYCLLYGQDAKTSFDWNAPKACTPKEKLNQDEASALVRQLQEAHTITKDHMANAQEQMKTAANKNCCEVNFGEGDKIWLSLKLWTTECPSKKLNNQHSGPYKILEKRGHSFKLELPDSTQIHLVHLSE